MTRARCLNEIAPPRQLRRWACKSFVRELARQIKKGWRRYALWGLFWSAILVPLTATFIYISTHEGDNSRPHVPELRKLAEEIPLYPNAQKTGDRVMLKHNLALLTVFYRSNGAFADVEYFYRRELTARGWTSAQKSNAGAYRRGDYFISLEADSHSTGFSISYEWAPQ